MYISFSFEGVVFVYPLSLNSECELVDYTIVLGRRKSSQRSYCTRYVHSVALSPLVKGTGLLQYFQSVRDTCV
jgi:hypothetical protein